jgi:hypothetical protein
MLVGTVAMDARIDIDETRAGAALLSAQLMNRTSAEEREESIGKIGK